MFVPYRVALWMKSINATHDSSLIDSKSLHIEGRYRSLSPEETFCHSVTPIFSSWQSDFTAVSFPQPGGPLSRRMPFVFFMFLTDSVIHLFSSLNGFQWGGSWTGSELELVLGSLTAVKEKHFLWLFSGWHKVLYLEYFLVLYQ